MCFWYPISLIFYFFQCFIIIIILVFKNVLVNKYIFDGGWGGSTEQHFIIIKLVKMSVIFFIKIY